MHLWATNLDCPSATAFPVESLGLSDHAEEAETEPCPNVTSLTVNERVTCRSVAGFTCTLRVPDFGAAASGYRGSCRQDQNPFNALHFDYVFY